jgi:transposase
VEDRELAETIPTWRAEIARGVLTGYSNAAAEGVNLLVKLVYRTAFGLTNVPISSAAPAMRPRAAPAPNGSALSR